MSILLSISPLLIVIILCVWLRRPAYMAAWFGVLIVGVLMVVVPQLNTGLSLSHLKQNVGATSLITLQAALVMITGLYLNALMEQARAHETLVAWIRNIPMTTEHKQLLIVIGLAPALESLTGFGVSLLVTIPLLLAITERKTALRQSLLSMNIMPWGTLALATVVGSQLSGETVRNLGWHTSLVSIGVFPLLAIILGLLSAPIGNRFLIVRDGLFVGGVLSSGLLFMNWIGLTELAGVFAGFICTFGCWLLFGHKASGNIKIPWGALKPYILLFILVGLLRLLQLIGVPLDVWVLTIGNVHFAPLTSPAFPLLIVSLVLGRGHFHIELLRVSLQRATRPILTMGGFTLMAQLMVASGMIEIIREHLPISKPLFLAVLSPLLGAISGYLTGSNVGGNTLMMTMQSSFGNDFFSAIQNSSAGHAVFASMPMTLLALAIAGSKDKHEESELQRFALKVLFCVALLLVFTTIILVFLTNNNL